MNGGVLTIALFAVQIILLYVISRRMLVEFYYSLYLFTRNKNLSFSVLAVFFLPGTVLHEISHFFTAIILLLPVGEIRIMPEWDKNYIQFGRVTYGKKDFVRSILVGVAPFFGALFFFWFLGAFRLFPSANMALNISMGYLIFAVSSNMFSSKQDLTDLIYIIPLFIVAAAVIYITGFNFSSVLSSQVIGDIAKLLQRINFYITISLGIHLAVILFFKSLRLILKR